jgi:hypothetical protein
MAFELWQARWSVKPRYQVRFLAEAPLTGVTKMNFKDSVNEVRRKLGFLYPNSKEDTEWMIRKIIKENQEVFDRLA